MNSIDKDVSHDRIEILREKIKDLPQAPGVYFFKDARGEIMYIGKATNLRSRVRSYFKGVTAIEAKNLDNSGILHDVQDDRKGIELERGPWIALMVSQVVDIDFQQTDSVLEALILESNLIKKHQPKYNSKEKDDKSFAYFVITKEEFPRVLILRKTDLKNFVIPGENEESRDIKIGDIDAGSSRRYAPQDDKKKLKAKKLTSEKLKAVYGPYTSKLQMQIALKIIRRIFPFHSHKQKTEKGCLDFQLGVCPGPYADAITKEEYKKNIRGIRMILEGKKKRLVATMKKEMEQVAKKHEYEKAAQLRNKIFALEHIRDVALMKRDFEKNVFPHSQSLSQGEREGMEGNFRVEAYDISNISGDHAVASMVVFNDNQPDKSQYRKFIIKTVEGSNDVAMMKEVLERRFSHSLIRPDKSGHLLPGGEGRNEKTSDWAMPDLIILDGGQGHVNMAEKLLLEKMGLSVLIVGVAKGKTRKNLNLVFPPPAGGFKRKPMSQFPIEIQNFLNNENLLKHITDEAHRFAITFHRKKRSKGLMAE